MSNFKSTMFNQLKVINSQYNMTSLYGPTFSRGKFMVPLKDANKFLDSYHQFVFNNNQDCD